jgi:hypothetical protein
MPLLNGGAPNQDVHGICYEQDTAEGLLAEGVILALPFISLRYLKLLVHPIPTISNAFVAGGRFSSQKILQKL